MVRCVAALLLLCASPTFAQDSVVPSDRVTSFVNVRAQPSAESPEVGRLEVGESLPLVAAVPRWYEVRLPDGTRGFVAKSWTTISQALAPRAQGELRIHFLNVGTGSCAMVECPGANAAPMLVDCGALSAAPDDLDGAEARTYIQQILSTNPQPPVVVLSHADVDHYRHIPEVIGATQVAQVWQGGDPADYSEHGFPAWLKAQESGGASVRNRFPKDWHNDGEPVDDLACGDASTYVLTVNTGVEKNAQSLVLFIEHGEFAAIFSGDAEGDTEAQAIRNFDGNMKATVVTASHHGANTKKSNSPDWVAATSPEVVVYSAGSRFSHPTCAAMGRFTSVADTQAHDVRCGLGGSNYRNFRTDGAHYVTSVNGAIVVTSSGRSPARVNCTQSTECGVEIVH